MRYLVKYLHIYIYSKVNCEAPSKDRYSKTQKRFLVKHELIR